MTWKPVRQEQETTIRLDPGQRAGASTVRIWSASPPIWRKMNRLGIAPVKETATVDGTPTGKFYQVSAGQLR